MTVEATLLILVFFFLVWGIFLMPGKSFHNSGPRLAARIENNLSVGHDFNTGPSHAPVRWNTPKGAEPTGSFQ